MGYTFDIELYTDQPFVIEIERESNQPQTISGRIVLEINKPETFKLATLAIHGQVGVALNIDTKPSIVHEHLVEVATDLVAANDTDGSGYIEFDEPGTQYLPFRIDLPRPNELPPTLINKLDTPYIDWKYEIHATLQRNSLFSRPTVVKRDLTLRRAIPRPENAMHSVKTDIPNQFKSHISAPTSIHLGQEALSVSVDLKARHKEYMIKEVDCSVVQTEVINYYTKQSHPNVDNAHTPGIPSRANASRLVSAVKTIANEDADLDFGRKHPIELDLRLDNFQLIPSENMDWLELSHILKVTVHFMDVSLEPSVTELPLIVGHDDEAAEEFSAIKVAALGAARLMRSLLIAGTENHALHSKTDLAV
ncbi:hypothetical protein BGZ76_000488 [Entomortierella beljakovae]|nr:hypothetical protein BGZ76_000488 [Entomortierella beljakovae]